MVNFKLDTRVPGFRVALPDDEEGMPASIVPVDIAPAVFNPEFAFDPVPVAVPTAPLPSIFDLIAMSPYLYGSLSRSTDGAVPAIDVPQPTGWLSHSGESTTGTTMPAGSLALPQRASTPSFMQTMGPQRFPWSNQQANGDNSVLAGSGNNDQPSWFDSLVAAINAGRRPSFDSAFGPGRLAQAPTQQPYTTATGIPNAFDLRRLITRQTGSLPPPPLHDLDGARVFAGYGASGVNRAAPFAQPANGAQNISGGNNFALISSALAQTQGREPPAAPRIDRSLGDTEALPNGSIISSIGSPYGYVPINTIDAGGIDRLSTQGSGSTVGGTHLSDLDIHLVGDAPGDLNPRARHQLGVDASIAMHVERGFEIVVAREVAVDVPGFPTPRYYDYIIRDPVTGRNYGVEVKTTLYQTIQLRRKQVMKDAVVVAQGAKVPSLDIDLHGVSYSTFCFGCEALDLRSLVLQRILQNAGVPVTRGNLPGDVRP